MKNKLFMYVGLALVAGVLGGYLVSKPSLKQQRADGLMAGYQDRGFNQNQKVMGQPNRGNCLADDCLLVSDLEYPASELSMPVKEALDEAINDEYKALSVYEAVIEKFGMVRPFSMIKGAEEQHIASLKAIYDKYGLEVPENSWIGKVTAPETIQEACQTGVEAEIANADLYKNHLLPAVEDYEDIVMVFTNLMNASEQKHLAAFEKCN